MTDDGFRGLSEVVDTWRAHRDEQDWVTMPNDLYSVLEKAHEYMTKAEATPGTNLVAVDPVPAWTIYASDPDAVSMHQYNKMIAGQRGDPGLANAIQRHLDRVLLWRERNRIEKARQEDTVDMALAVPGRQCNSIMAHSGHLWENNRDEHFWCHGRRIAAPMV